MHHVAEKMLSLYDFKKAEKWKEMLGAQNSWLSVAAHVVLRLTWKKKGLHLRE